MVAYALTTVAQKHARAQAHTHTHTFARAHTHTLHSIYKTVIHAANSSGPFKLIEREQAREVIIIVVNQYGLNSNPSTLEFRP